MSAREAGREAAHRLLHTDPLSKESADLIADKVMDAFAPLYSRELADQIRQAPFEPYLLQRHQRYAAARIIDPEVRK